MAIPFLTTGSNDTRVFGLTPAERTRRFAVKAGLEPAAEAPATGPAIVADLAYAWDPAWLAWVKGRAGRAVTWQGAPVLTHLAHPASTTPFVPSEVEARAAGDPLASRPSTSLGTNGGGEVRDASLDATLYNEALRKRQDAYLLPLTPDTVGRIEKASYDGAYKGVTDILTLYLWRGLAFHLTRAAAKLRMTPNMVTLIGIAFCVWTFFLFWEGRYWTGIAAGLVFMVLDTVDGKLARCTGTSSRIGNILDHGVDLVHPPFWWWAWGVGLATWGDPMRPGELAFDLVLIVGGYVVQRLIEGVFMRRNGFMHIHVWQRIDSRFRLITARRNPNMVILFVALLLGSPRWGLVAVAWWTVASCLFHLVRLIQAERARARGEPITSWLAG